VDYDAEDSCARIEWDGRFEEAGASNLDQGGRNAKTKVISQLHVDEDIER
jgi:hypothetical protein